MQRIAIDQTHIDEELPIDFAPVVDGHDMGLLENSGGTRFPKETSPESFVFCVLVEEDFEGNRSTFIRVVGLIHLTHSTLADEGDELVLAETGTDTRVGCSHFRVLALRNVDLQRSYSCCAGHGCGRPAQ